MGKKGKTVLFVLALIMIVGVLGYSGFQIVKSQKASRQLREAAAKEQEQEQVKNEVATQSVIPTVTSTPTPTATPIATEAPTPTPIAPAFSFRGDTLYDDGTDAATGYAAQFAQLLKDGGHEDIQVFDYLWENRGSLSQMRLAGVSEEEVNRLIQKHQDTAAASGADLAATETVISDDLADFQKDRDDLDAIPVLSMGFYGGWNGDTAELVEQYKLMLATYHQQDRYLILGEAPYNYSDTEGFDAALSEAFGEHYLPLHTTNSAFDAEGRKEIAQLILDKATALDYLSPYTPSSAVSAGEQEAAQTDDLSETTPTPTEAADEGETDASADQDRYTLTADDGAVVYIQRSADGTVYTDQEGALYEKQSDGTWSDGAKTYRAE